MLKKNTKKEENRISRKQFLKNAGILGGAVAISAVANKSKVNAAVSDNADSEDISEDVVYFESVDGTTASVPTAKGVQDVGMPSVLANGEKTKSVFNKISLAFKNLRYLLAFTGSTDISDLSDEQTITGALDTLNTRVNSIIAASTDFEGGHQYSVGDVIIVNGKAYECIKKCFTASDKETLYNLDSDGTMISFYVKGADEAVDASLYWKQASDYDNSATLRKDLGYPSEASSVDGDTAFAKIATLQSNFSSALATLKNSAIVKALGLNNNADNEIINNIAAKTSAGTKTISQNGTTSNICYVEGDKVYNAVNVNVPGTTGTRYKFATSGGTTAVMSVTRVIIANNNITIDSASSNTGVNGGSGSAFGFSWNYNYLDGMRWTVSGNGYSFKMAAWGDTKTL